MKATLPPGTKGLRILKDFTPRIGPQFSTWGYPFGHAGPAPLWTIGYLSGFTTTAPASMKAQGVKHLVITGAFNPGNSGGPLLANDAVAGVVVSKRLFSISAFQASALQALAKNQSGVIFTGTDDKGKQITFVESQLVADLLEYYRQVSQVFIGEAIAAEELIAFLNAHQIHWNNGTPTTSKK
jgi:hypothetical protein